MSINDLRPSVAPAMVRRSTRPPTRLRRALITGDIVATFATWTIASALPGSWLAKIISHPTPNNIAIATVLLSTATLVSLLVFAIERLYLSRVCSMRTIEIARIARASLVLGAFALVTARLFGEAKVARFPISVGALTFFLVNFWRMGFGAWLRNARRGGRFTRPVLLVGANDDALSLYHLVRTHPQLGYRVVGILGDDFTVHQYNFGGIPILGETDALETVLDTMDIDGAFVAGGAFDRDVLNKTIRTLLNRGVHIQLSTGIKGIDHRRMRSLSLAYEPMVYVERADLEVWQLAVKRAMDIAIAGILLLLTSPILAITSLLIKKHDRGPVMFRQERVGRHGRTFTILKFRSMDIDAEAKLFDLRHENVRQGPLFKLSSDPRVTPVGRFIRATSIDELPQLINVLRGDMSLVGPRPALPAEVEAFDDELLVRQHVMPGITGLWQVEGRDNPDFTLYQRLDLFYVENWSVALDFSILVGTAKVVVSRAISTVRRRKSSARATSASVVLE